MYKAIYSMELDIEKSIPATNKEIEEAEKQLSISFGKEYKEFLKEFGCLSVSYLEFYGICGSKLLAPNTLYITSKFRDEIPNFSKELIIIYEVGNGVFYSIDTNDNVYLCQYDKYEKMNFSFKDFIYKKLEEV